MKQGVCTDEVGLVLIIYVFFISMNTWWHLLELKMAWQNHKRKQIDTSYHPQEKTIPSKPKVIYKGFCLLPAGDGLLNNFSPFSGCDYAGNLFYQNIFHDSLKI